jgi:hypothetical protein
MDLNCLSYTLCSSGTEGVDSWWITLELEWHKLLHLVLAIVMARTLGCFLDKGIQPQFITCGGLKGCTGNKGQFPWCAWTDSGQEKKAYR